MKGNVFHANILKFAHKIFVRRAKLQNIVFGVLIVLLSACNLTKNVPPKHYLLSKNKLVVDNANVSEDDLLAIIRQQPNQKTIGINFKLRLYNAIDSAKVTQRKLIRIAKFNRRIEHKRKRANKTNLRRIEKAHKKGKTKYLKKEITDTTFSKIIFRERLKYKIGQKPIVFDSILYKKSIEQLGLYLRKTGYYYNHVSGKLRFIENKRKVEATYNIETGPVYKIDSVKVVGQYLVRSYYNEYLKKTKESTGEDPLIGKPFDLNYLDDYRERVAKYMRDKSIYKFNGSNIHFVADTFKSTMKVNLTLRFEDRFIPSPSNKDSLIKVPFQATVINKVYFHLADTIYYSGSFADSIAKYNLDLRDPLSRQFNYTLDTLFYGELPYNRKKRKKLKVGKEVSDPLRQAYITYNGYHSKKSKINKAIPWIKPQILELQNYLEHTNTYKEYYLDRSYRSLNQLGVFSTIKPVLVEIPGTNKIDVHYYLEASKKQSFGFEPKFTTSFGLLGVSASANYTNKNLFHGANKMTISLGGGFESQPQVFEDNTRGGRTFNTFEFGPSVKLDLPGLFPIPVTTLSKRQRPRTVIMVAYNYEKRDIFNRRVFQLNYLWKFFEQKTQVFQFGLPGASIIKFVNIDKSAAFQSQLNQINDVFMSNTYSNQFIWQDFKFSWEYNNKDKDYKAGKRPFLNANIYFVSTFDAAGNTLSLFRSKQDTANGQYLFKNLAYSQFVRLDNQFILTKKLPRKTSVHFRLNAGGGIPFGNSKTSMPYDYSFFGGGSNDNRGWRARALGPGAYQYHLDSNRISTQIADIRLGGSLEYRFAMGSMLKGAVFSDFGNIWTYKEDPSRIGSQFKLKAFIPQLAWSAGLGLRVDLDFFVIRFDLGFPLYNPAFSKEAHWVFQDLFSKSNFRESYYREGTAVFGADAIAKYLADNPGAAIPSSDDAWKYIKKYGFMPKPFVPVFNFGIGYPF